MSYAQWLAIIRDSANEYTLEKNRQRDTPTECPNDGEPLRSSPDGTLYCPYDGWRTSGTASDN